MGSQRLKLLAISDTHLGEETSLLSFPRGLQQLWQTLAKDKAFWTPIFPDFDPDERVQVEDLVLVGDISDRTLSSTSQISANTHAFAMMLGDALEIERAVYVPGNHDHTLWTDYNGAPGITSYRGQDVVRNGSCLDDGAEEILSIFLGYPIGWAWWALEKAAHVTADGFVFSIANPVYAKEVAGRTYAFAHGTHFRSEMVSGWEQGLLRVGGMSNLDHLLDLEIQPGGNIEEVEDMTGLEEAVSRFVDSLWPSSKNRPTSRSDELWYLLTLLREGSEVQRTSPERSAVFSRENLSNDKAEGRVAKLTDKRGEPSTDSLERFRKLFLPHLETHLRGGRPEGRGLPTEELVFVYGDTHQGGWGELNVPGRSARVRVYNCGGWVVDGPRTHPACHLFAVDEEGQEFILDVSFAKDLKGASVQVGDDTLLQLAARDAEHRIEAVNRAGLAFGRGWQYLRSRFG
jgi:hypothetical protein